MIIILQKVIDELINVSTLNPLDICVLLHVLLLVLNFKSYSLLFIIQIFSLLVYEGSLGKVQQLL